MQLSFRYFKDYSTNRGYVKQGPTILLIDIFLTDLYLVLCKLNLLFISHFCFFFLCKGNIIIFTVSAMSIVYKLHIHSVKLHILKFRWGHHSFPLKHLFSLFNQPCLGFSRKFSFLKNYFCTALWAKKWEKSAVIHCFFS